MNALGVGVGKHVPNCGKAVELDPSDPFVHVRPQA